MIISALTRRFSNGRAVGSSLSKLPSRVCTAEVLDIIFNDALLRKFRGNLERMDRANALSVILSDLEAIVAESRSGAGASEKEKVLVT